MRRTEEPAVAPPLSTRAPDRRRPAAAASLLLWLGVLAAPAAADPAVLRVTGPQGSTVSTLDVAALEGAAAQDGSGAIVLEDVALSDAVTVDLELHRFRVTTAATRFVRGGVEDGDADLPFDPDDVVLLRGGVRGEAGSHAFLAIWSGGGFGRVERGGECFRMVAGHRGAGSAAAGTFAARRLGGLPPAVPACAAQEVRRDGAGGDEAGEGDGGGGEGGAAAGAGTGPVLAPESTRVVRLAVDADYEFFSLHPLAAAASAYIVQLYGAVSDIYMRDLNTRVELSFVRLWETPQDLFNQPDPLASFRISWETTMTDVVRDAAQLLSGRRDLPYGGVAYYQDLCTDFAYSVVGYIRGFFPDPAVPHPDHYDIDVCAHELGHNCGALHTHDYGIDTCDQPGPARRGTIMSYCAQTRSGANANTDHRFHTQVQQAMRWYILSRPCLIIDCNGNGVDDAIDIGSLSSFDLNVNGIPDECEDCNGNELPDPSDVLLGFSADLNGNLVPDECEADCNGNGAPDDFDIATLASSDLYGDGVPDECEADCDENGVSDYTQILADMSLDVNRNAILDSCEDCDGDGTPDLDALAGAHDLWVGNLADGALREFHALTGVSMRVSGEGRLLEAQDVLIDDTGRILVSSAGDDRIVQFDRFATYVGDFVSAGAGGLSSPAGMAFGPNGNLFVASRGTHQVLEFDGEDGAFAGVFVSAAAGGLTAPFGLAFGPNGDLFATSTTNEVMEYDGATGAFVGVFVDGSGSEALADPHGIAFRRNGNLLVASFGSDQILEYDGATGALVGQFNHGGTTSVLTLDHPWGVRIGPDGNVYVSRHGEAAGAHDGPDRAFLPDPLLHLTNTQVYMFDGETGLYLRSLVSGLDVDISLPTGFDFYPGDALDCNRNGFPDACDVASGRSLDLDGNGIPDECECRSDLDASGDVGFADLLALLGDWGACPSGCLADLDASGDVGFADLLIVLSEWGPC